MRSIFILVFLVFFSRAYADVKPNSLFSDHAVFQRGIEVPIWGTASEGEQVTVAMAGQKVMTKTKDGKWMVKLKPLKAGGPYTLTINGTNEVLVRDILVGEVWICSGQSNMARQLGPHRTQKPIDNWEKERDEAKFPRIRQYKVPLQYAVAPVDDANSAWQVCSPETVKDFSAVGYFFARDLYEALDVPVGILFSAYGGSRAESWASRAKLASIPELASLTAAYDKAVTDKTQKIYPVGLYNAMLTPLIPYGIKGVCWYQGENNNNLPKQYQTLLPAMIENWREEWQQGDFLFLQVQIAPNKNMTPELREAQQIVAQKTKNVGMVVITDCGDADDIHPTLKKPVGQRLALAARAMGYNQKLVYSGPVLRSMKVKKDRVILKFSHTGTGLMAKNGALKGFTIAGEDKKFVPAKVELKKRKIIAYNEAIGRPVAVRYGWANVPEVNLYNQEGLPASPFRTDVE